MNPSHPISSHISRVSFGHLSTRDIEALSAKQISSATTFDSLLHPLSAGLYSLELGQFGDNACLTCGLKTPQCPGHCGHITLPVPCYHPTFLNQALRLLRAGCVYCHRLKMSRVQLHAFLCRLRLVRYGLLRELSELDDFDARAVHGRSHGEDKAEGDPDSDSDSALDVASGADAKALMERRDRFVKQALHTAQMQYGSLSTDKTEATINARRAIVADFLSSITKGKVCRNCAGVNHSYRKDGFVKIFRKPLSNKEKIAMVQSGHRARDPMVEMRKRQEKSASRKRKRDADEGVADLGLSDEDDKHDGGGDDGVEDEESSEGEAEIVDGSMLDSSALEGRSSKRKAAANAAAKVEEYLNPSRVYAQLAQLFEREQEILSLVYGHHQSTKKLAQITPDMFFLQTILVPPNRYRPETRTGPDEIGEAPENTLYKSILSACETLSTIQRELTGTVEANPRYRTRTYADLQQTWIALQNAVNSLIDRDRNPMLGPAARRNPDGIKQKLEKKEGMFRKYMMGKRVNFAARTVISPDPNIETNEIGVPPVFALKLTYPEPVTQWNVEELQEAVRNGPHVWPGAVAIEAENGAVVKLERKNGEERTALANQLLAPTPGMRGGGASGRPKKVHRHLNNGDVVIMNRQPTLHKPSMMCHRARILPGEKTLRMHYANCNTYNADFDGDEMNLHFPQNELARAEALSIADTDHQYLSGTAGNPLRGLIQDHISMGVLLTNRDTTFERGEYMQLLYAALRPENGHCASGRVETVAPAMLKPRALWTGKQVITSVLLNVVPQGYQGLTLTGKSTTNSKLWGPAGQGDEGDVVFHEGYFCQGILDKKQIGPSSGGFVNAVYELYGHTVAGRLLSVLGRLLTRLENMRAFSCGVQDLLFTSEGEEQRRQALAGAETVGLEVAARYIGLGDQAPKASDRELKRRLEDVQRDDAKQLGLDQLTNNATSALSTAVTMACLPAALIKPFPANQMQLMTSSGAKGTAVNANQISCNLGQQVLEGRRVPVMVSGKTLPCFRPWESSARAGGYIVDRFLTGVRPQEFFFHAMAGREGLIDTAVKTSRSGYLQRCVIKGMEGLKVQYDTSVRDSDGTVVQFLYGEDGLDVAKGKSLMDFKFAAENHLSLFQSMGGVEDWGSIISTDAREWNKMAEKKVRKTGDLGAVDPALTLWPPARFAGSTSESLYVLAKQYVDTNPERLIRDKKPTRRGEGSNVAGLINKKNFHAILDVRYLKAVVEAGEAVGVIAGQSIGEPSTQMTLNTFHLAGHSAKNVTLGIPRLREIVMTAARNLSTPTMTLRLNDGLDLEEGRKFAKGISRLALAEVLDTVTVTESQGKGVAYAQARRYEVRMEFFKRTEYESEYAITVDDVAATVEHRFLPKLQVLARKELKKRGDERALKAAVKSDALPEVGRSTGTVEQEKTAGRRDSEQEDEDDGGEDDATREKEKENQMQAGYEAMEDEDETALAAKSSKREARGEAESEDETYGGSPRAPAGGESSSDENDDNGSDDEAGDMRRSAVKDREIRIRGDRKTNDVTRFAFSDTTGDLCTFTLEYDASAAKILMLHLVESAARAALVQSVPGITSAVLDEGKPKKDEKKTPAKPAAVMTSGVNLPAMWSYPHILHPHHLYTNDIHAMLQHYGVEAARATIALELNAVFAGHGIAVDTRHLTLIADYMTRNGGYQAFSRMAYRGNASPFMKMSFETTVDFLREAVQSGDWDDLKGPSARIVVGRLGDVGTGGVDVFLPVSAGGDAE